MSSGRWNDRTRGALVVAGFLLVIVGGLLTFRFQSGAGAAALVTGGFAMSLVGVAGGMSLARAMPTNPEMRLSAAAEAQQAGDTEGALDRFAQALRLYAPENADYHEAATQAMYQAAGRAGEQLRPLYGFLLSPLAMSGSLVLVDIRGGTGFSLTRMQSTYQTLLVGPPTMFDAVLVVLNAPDGHSTVQAVNQLAAALGCPVVAVAWRVDDPVDALLAGIDRVRRQVADRAPALATVGTAPVGLAGSAPAPAVDPVRPGPVLGPSAGPAPATGVAPVPPVAAAPVQAPRVAPAPPPVQAAPPIQAAPPASAIGSAIVGTPATRDVPEQPSAGRRSPSPDPGARRADDDTVQRQQGGPWPAGRPSTEPAAAPAVGAAAVPRQAPPPRPTYDDSAAWRRATELHWQGQLQDAEGAYGQIIGDRTRALGPEHPDTLAARDQHATVLRDLDRLGEALHECEDVLAARTRSLGQDHPDTLTSRSHLATIYHQLGELAQAETEHQRVLHARTRVLGPTHQETLISRSNLAKVHQDLGELDRAVDEHRQVLEARARLLGPEHRDTLMSRSLLASALHQAGRLEEAEAQHRRVLRSRLRLLGPVHLDTAVSRHRLASVLHDINRLNEAIAEYRAAYDIYSELLGSGSPFARAAASDLALAERAADQR
jgi:tetratricopeptide (TPR) repeat protein